MKIIQCLIMGLALVFNFTLLEQRSCENIVPYNYIEMNCTRLDDCLNSCYYDSNCNYAFKNEKKCLKAVNAYRLDDERNHNEYNVYAKKTVYLRFQDIRCDALYTKRACNEIEGCNWNYNDKVCVRECKI